jgi:tripartite-type tricarboxylate transporter receptor subunit TctC
MRKRKPGAIGRTAKLLAAACLVSLGAGGWSQEFPSRPITIVVPFPPGGGTDIFARAIGRKLSSAFAKPVVVENRTGATGNIGAEAVARSTADGHTLLYTSASIALSTLAYSKPGFEPQRDLAPVSMTVSIPYVLVVHPSVPARRMSDLIELARARPGALNFASAGPGSSLHLAMELLKLQAQIDLHHVPYRGAAPAQTALLGGEVDTAFLVPPLVQGHVKTGRLRALAVSSTARSPMFSEVPTLQEAGITGYEALQWHGFFVPAKTPAPVVDRLYREVATALAAPDMAERLTAEGASVVGSTPAQFAAFFRAEVGKWSEVVRVSGLKFD